MTSPHPHERAAAAVRADILNGTFAPGTRLPAQRAMAERYGVAQNTMGLALRILEAEGLIETAPRRRSLVLQPAPPMEVRLAADGHIRPVDTSRVGRNDLRARARSTNSDAAEALGLAPDSLLFVRQSVLLYADAPWAVQTLLTARALDVPAGDEAATQAPFLAGAGALGRETRNAIRWSARPAALEERELLRARPDATVMDVRRVGFTEERPTSYLLTVVRADRVTVLMESAG